MQMDAAVHAGTLRGQPYLSDLAWERGHRHGHTRLTAWWE